jgi:histidyl-tRNA synthetase
MKSQMKKADQSGAIYALIFGEREGKHSSFGQRACDSEQTGCGH